MRAEHRQSLLYAMRKLKEYKPHIRSIYIYGSCARGTETSKSDVDLFLFMNDGTSSRLMREIRCEVIPLEDGLPEVDVHFSTTDQFSGSQVFNTQLEREAVEIWRRN